jgi:acyl-CoA reductase-like NAD-dependent aldehyde dehydrogenase
MSAVYRQYIGGEWTDASNGGVWEVRNPAAEDVIATVPFGTGADCERAIAAAVAAFPSWSRRTPYDRGAILKRAADIIRSTADDLARTTVLESGKPTAQARGEWMVCADLVRVLAQAGVPAGAANLVNGEPEPMGQAMLAHPGCAKVHFTGSVRVGKLLMDGASKTVTRLSLELGGNAPVLIFPDVDLKQLAAGAVCRLSRWSRRASRAGCGPR